MHTIDRIVSDIKSGFSSLNNLNRQDKRTILKYYKVLLKLDKEIEKLELTSKVRANLQNAINFPIENALHDKVLTSSKEEMPKTTELIKEETERLKDEIYYIRGNNVYYATRLREDAKTIMLRYMSEDKIEEVTLKCYPSNQEELESGNSLKPGSIVKLKAYVRK